MPREQSSLPGHNNPPQKHLLMVERQSYSDLEDKHFLGIEDQELPFFVS